LPLACRRSRAILVRAAEEKTKPNSERLREYRDSGIAISRATVVLSAPVYKNLDTALLADFSGRMQDALGKDNPKRAEDIERARLPADAAKEMIAGTKLDDVAVRKQLYEGGKAAIAASNDPLIVAMRAIEPDALALRKEFDDKIDSVVRLNGTLIAKARLPRAASSQPPDATFTLRLSYGAVKGYNQKMGRTFPTSRLWRSYEHGGGAQ